MRLNRATSSILRPTTALCLLSTLWALFLFFNAQDLHLPADATRRISLTASSTPDVNALENELENDVTKHGAKVREKEVYENEVAAPDGDGGNALEKELSKDGAMVFVLFPSIIDPHLHPRRLEAIRDTWGQNEDVVFVSDSRPTLAALNTSSSAAPFPTSSSNSGRETRHEEWVWEDASGSKWERFLAAVKHVLKHRPKMQYMVKADTNVYLYKHNLRGFVAKQKVRAYIHTHTHTYMHACIHTSIQTQSARFYCQTKGEGIHTYINTDNHNMQSFIRNRKVRMCVGSFLSRLYFLFLFFIFVFDDLPSVWLQPTAYYIRVYILYMYKRTCIHTYTHVHT
jgi:hypothetical protein